MALVFVQVRQLGRRLRARERAAVCVDTSARAAVDGLVRREAEKMEIGPFHESVSDDSPHAIGAHAPCPLLGLNLSHFRHQNITTCHPKRAQVKPKSGRVRVHPTSKTWREARVGFVEIWCRGVASRRSVARPPPLCPAQHTSSTRAHHPARHRQCSSAVALPAQAFETRC